MFHFAKKGTSAKAFITLLLLTISVGKVNSQGVRLFTSADGIPSNRIISIHQDAEGYIWLGNDGGLSRMIGSTITTFYEAPEEGKLKSNVVNTFLSDNLGQLWIATGAGLYLYHPLTERFENIPLAQGSDKRAGNTIRKSRVSTMTLLPYGKKMLVSLGATDYNVVNIRTHSVLRNETDAFNNLLKGVTGRKLFCDSKQRLWIVTNNGIVLANLKSMSVIPLQFDNESGITSNNLEITCIIEDRNTHNLLLGDTQYGVLIYDELTNSIRQFSRLPTEYRNVQCLLQLKNGTVLVGCDRNGIGHLNYASNTIDRYPSFDATFNLSACKVHNMLEDCWGNIYICLYQKGLLVVPPFKGGFRFRAISNGIVTQNNTAVTSIVKSPDNKIYVSTDGNGIFSGIDFDQMQRMPLPSGCNGNIYKMLPDKDGKLWIATYGSGLFVSNNGITESVSNQKTAINRNVSCLSFDKKQQRLFIGNIGNGLNELNLATGKMINLSFCRPWIFSLYTDSRNRLWIGGPECIVYDLNSSKVRRLTLNSGKNILCYTFLEFKELLYIGTNNGLYIYDEATNRIKRVSLRGNRGFSIYALAKSGNNQLWMSSNLGLIRFNPKKETTHLFASYEIKKTGDFFVNSVLELNDGTIVFGGDNGVVGFNPNKLEHESKNTEILRLTTLSVDGKPTSYSLEDPILDAAIPNATRIKLPYTQNSFAVGFSVFNYTVSSKVRFKYRLEGYDNQWNATSTDRPQAVYNQVPSGKYKLVIKCFNEEFDRPLSEKSIDVTVAAPWYWSWWSKLLYILTTISISCGLWYIYQTRQRSRKRLRALLGELLSLKQSYQILIQKYNNDLPQQPDSLNDKLKKNILRVISDNSHKSTFGVEELSREVAMSRVHLYRRTKELFNCSPNDLIKAERMKKAGFLLVQSNTTVADIAYQSGFSDPSYFSRSFKSYYNMTPKEFVAKYRDNGDEETIRELFEI